MRAKTRDGERLKRLARKYADACVELSWIGSRAPDFFDDIREEHRKARKKLFDEIDRLTSLDLTPRAVMDE